MDKFSKVMSIVSLIVFVGVGVFILVMWLTKKPCPCKGANQESEKISGPYITLAQDNGNGTMSYKYSNGRVITVAKPQN